VKTNPRLIGRHYSWVVVGLSFLTVGVAFGCRSSFAVFLVAVIQEFLLLECSSIVLDLVSFSQQAR
jgi:hypothetical protein